MATTYGIAMKSSAKELVQVTVRITERQNAVVSAEVKRTDGGYSEIFRRIFDLGVDAWERQRG
jgi:hypothetical protein